MRFPIHTGLSRVIRHFGVLRTHWLATFDRFPPPARSPEFQASARGKGWKSNCIHLYQMVKWRESENFQEANPNRPHSARVFDDSPSLTLRVMKGGTET